MDKTRDGNLQRLHSAFNDPLLPMRSRRAAWRSFNKILIQIKDRRLTELRHRLARAQLGGDSEAVERITMNINDYSIRKGY